MKLSDDRPNLLDLKLKRGLNGDIILSDSLFLVRNGHNESVDVFRNIEKDIRPNIESKCVFKL